MKEVLVELKITNVANNIISSQQLDGGLPKINTPPAPFRLDGVSDDEILYKLVRNVLAVYCQAVDNNLDNLPARWGKFKELIK